MSPGKENILVIQEISVNMKVMWLTPDAAYLLLQLRGCEWQKYLSSFLSWAGSWFILFTIYICFT